MRQCDTQNGDGRQCEAEVVEGERGGRSPRPRRPRGRPVGHGAYSGMVKAEEVPTLEQLRALGVGLEEEVAVARLQLARALAWAEEQRPARCDGRQCPYDVVESRLDLVSRLALRCQRITEGVAAQFVEEAEVARLVEVIERHVTDPETRAAIARELRGEEQ